MKERGIDIKLIKGNSEKEIIRAGKNIQANLILIGREQKNILGIPVKRIKKKIMERCKYSILFFN